MFFNGLQENFIYLGFVLFGRFEKEFLLWEKRLFFLYNRYLEEVERFFKFGFVIQMRVYFEVYFKKKGIKFLSFVEV